MGAEMGSFYVCATLISLLCIYLRNWGHFIFFVNSKLGLLGIGTRENSLDYSVFPNELLIDSLLK